MLKLSKTLFIVIYVGNGNSYASARVFGAYHCAEEKSQYRLRIDTQI